MTEPLHEQHHILPVWFFVGLLLSIYGVLIVITGLMQWSHPPQVSFGGEQWPVLTNLHAPVWWGAILIVLGSAYLIKFRPGRNV